MHASHARTRRASDDITVAQVVAANPRPAGRPTRASRRTR